MKHSIFILFFTILFSSCINNDPIQTIDIPDYDTINETEIQEYLSANNLTAQKTDSGLHYIVSEEGTGDYPTPNSNVTIAYKGYFLNGSVFDESDEDGITFNLQGVIDGWTEGIPYFKEGGKGILLIPSKLGYGYFNYFSIPGGSVLIFDINLISID